MADLSRHILGQLPLKEAEAKALGASLLWDQDVHIDLNNIKTDALCVVQGLSYTTFQHSTFGDLVQDISHLLYYFPRAK